MHPFGMHARYDGSFDDAVAKVTEALKTEGFGVLTEIDLRSTLKKKLDVDFRRYTILGACNPPFAYRALTANLDVGLLLPCNIAIYEEEAGGTHVAAVDPVETMGARGDAGLQALAGEVREKLARVLAQVSQARRTP